MIGARASRRAALRALLLLAVAAGLVLMHHVVGAHQHAPEQPAVAPATSAHHLSVPTPEPSTTAALHVHHDQEGHDDADAVLHMCLAVLAAALALVVAHLLTGRRHDLERERPARATARPRRSRPPLPVPLRLAQLQILRL